MERQAVQFARRILRVSGGKLAARTRRELLYIVARFLEHPQPFTPGEVFGEAACRYHFFVSDDCADWQPALCAALAVACLDFARVSRRVRARTACRLVVSRYDGLWIGSHRPGWQDCLRLTPALIRYAHGLWAGGHAAPTPRLFLAAKFPRGRGGSPRRRTRL